MHGERSLPATPNIGIKRRHEDTSKDLRTLPIHDPDGANDLDLSIHCASKPFGNRYEALSRLSPTSEKKSTQRPSSSNRWPCSSRKSKDHRKPRDGRRKKYRFSTADLLDEQLSLEFDKTLSAANVQRTAQPANDKQFKSPAPSSIWIQEPYVKFGGLNMMNHMPTITVPPPPKLEMPKLLPQLPSWCPKLPVFVDNDMKVDGFPLFFDLSHIPEPKVPPKSSSRDQEMQLWRVKPTPHPKKQSLFFPPLREPTPKARPAHTERPAHSSPSPIQQITLPSSFFTAQDTEFVDTVARGPGRSKQINAYAANLWGLLVPAEIEARDSRGGPYANGFKLIPGREIFAAPYGQFDHRLESIGMPVELDSVEIPFVHDNCLVGLANERDEHAPAMLKHNTPIHSRVAWSTIQSSITSNEQVLERLNSSETDTALPDLLSLPALPPTPPPESSFPILPAYFPPTCSDEIDTDLERTIRTLPIYDTQAMTPPLSPLLQPTDDDMIDIIDLLAPEHSLECWCISCQEPPELIDPESWVYDDEWSTVSTWAGSRESSSVCSAWESEWGIFIDEGTSWDEEDWTYEGDVWWSKPSCVAHGPW